MKKATKKTTLPAGAACTDTIKKAGQDPAQEKDRPDVVPMPTAGRKVTEFENRLDVALAAGEQEPKRGRGRPKKIEEPPPPEIDVKVFAQCLQIPFDLWSASQDIPELKISIDEAVLMAKPLKQLTDYYVPAVPEIAWAWISLAGVSYTIVKSRLGLIAEIKKANTVEAEPDTVKGVPNQERESNKGHGRPGPAGFPNIATIKEQTVK